MWLWLTVGSAILLGLYDVAKKQSLKRNSVLYVLLASTALSTLFLTPFLSSGPAGDYLKLLVKAVLVTSSWISGLAAMKLLPLTTASTIKASRPMFVVLFSVLIYGERLNLWQWTGAVVVLLSLYLLSASSKKEGIDFRHSKGVAYMLISVFTGVASALYDKLILKSMEALFVQSWGNLYITILLGIIVLIQALKNKENRVRFQWDWMLLIIAVFITIADFLYFFALRQEDALLSVVSMVRRCSVVVTFFGGAWLFKEHNVRSKAFVLLLLLCGMALLLFGSH